MPARRVVLVAVAVAPVAGLLAAGVAWAASVTNVYSVKASVAPVRSGTRRHPKPISSTLEWDVSTAPSGDRPADVSRYAISYQGIDENTTLFAGCATSTLSAPNATVNSCPRRSRIGSGYLILGFGATGFSQAAYNPICAASLAIFNGAYHDLTLFVYQGQPGPSQPTECTIPGNHVAIHVRIVDSRRGIAEIFNMPLQLLHPAPGLDTAVIKGVITVPAKQRVLGRPAGGRSAGSRIGLFESYACPPSHKRRVAMTFTRQDGVAQTQATSTSCR